MKTNRWKLPMAIRRACNVLQSGSRRLTEADIDAAVGGDDINAKVAELARAIVVDDSLDSGEKIKRLKKCIELLSDSDAEPPPEIPDGGADDIGDLPPLDAAESFARQVLGKRLIESRGSPRRLPGKSPAQFAREVRGR